MSRALEDYRSLQIDLRLLTQTLGELNDEEKTHPDKADQYASLERQAAWAKRRAIYTKRREAFKKQLKDKQEQRDMLYLNLTQSPLTMQSLAEVIDTLTSVEAAFATDGPNAAWDQLSGVIDGMERDVERVEKLKAVKAA